MKYQSIWMKYKCKYHEIKEIFWNPLFSATPDPGLMVSRAVRVSRPQASGGREEDEDGDEEEDEETEEEDEEEAEETAEEEGEEEEREWPRREDFNWFLGISLYFHGISLKWVGISWYFMIFAMVLLHSLKFCWYFQCFSMIFASDHQKNNQNLQNTKKSKQK